MTRITPWIAVVLLTACPQARAFQSGAHAAHLELAARPGLVEEHRASAELASLEADTATRWRVSWDPWTGVARRGSGAQVAAVRVSDPWQRAEAFLAQHGALLGASGATLDRVRWKHAARSWHATWQQRLAGRRVVGCFADLTLNENGQVVAFRSSLVPGLQPGATGSVTITQARRACETRLGHRLENESDERVWVPIPQGGRYVPTSAWRLELRGEHGARWSALVDANTARVLEFESLLRTESLAGVTSGDVKPLYATDAAEGQRFPWLRLGLQRLDSTSADSVFSDGNGNYRFSKAAGVYSLGASLDGRYVSVRNDILGGESPGFRSEVTLPGQADVVLDASNSRDDERTIYYHTNVIHEYVSQRFGFTLLDFPVPAVAAVRNPNNGNPDYANAFWDGTRMAFGTGGDRFLNLGLFADVIYHEYTHAITDHVYRPARGLRGQIGGAIHEGLSDYFACTITNEPLLGEFVAGGLPLRDLEHDLRWPEDRHPNDETHANGLILAGALWHTRQLIGAETADPIIHFARELFPQDFDEYLNAMLMQDDFIFGDGLPGNGSPHREAILSAFARHGMGPLRNNVVRIQHRALLDTEQTGVSREVRVGVGSPFPDAVDQVELHWRADAGAFVSESMQRDTTGEFVAEIPGMPSGARVEYWVRSIKLRPFEQHRLPEGAPETVFSYAVGPDASPPRITHGTRSEVPAFAWPTELHLRIEDNLGLAYAYVEYTLNGERGASLGLLRASEDPNAFVTRFPPVGGQVGDVIEYWITAVDASRAAHVTRLPAEGALRIQLVRDLDEGFEHGVDAWMHTSVVAGRPDPWHVTAQFNHTPSGRHAWWCGTDAADYPASTAAALATDGYRIGTGARASVWSWMEAEQNGPQYAFDGGIVQLQGDADQVWEDLEPIGGYTHLMSATQGSNVLLPGTPCLSGRNDTWQRLEFDLSAWAGQRVRLRFVFGADNQASFVPLRGWLLDDFTLDAGTQDPTDALDTPAASLARLLAAPPWPNPFNPHVSFDLQVPEGAGRVRLEVFDARGRLVSRLVDGELPAAARRVVWNGSDHSGRGVPSGTYFYRLWSRWGAERGRLVLLR